MVFGVQRVGVDFGASIQAEAGLLNQFNRQVFAHIALGHLLGLGLVGAAPVVDDAQDAAGFERLVKGAQRLL